MAVPVVAFVGPRALALSPAGSFSVACAPPVSVPALVGSVLAAGRSVAVGCAAGADAAVVAAALGAGGAGRLSVLAVAPSLAAAPAGVRAAAAAGASVVLGAGGSAPAGAAALSARSAAVVRLAAAGGPGSGLVALLGPVPCPGGLVPSASPSRCWRGFGSGSWAAVAFAVGLGLPVVVFGGGLLPSWPGGRWAPSCGAPPSASSSPWALGFSWVPSPPLFGAA